MILNVAPWALYAACLALGWGLGEHLRADVGRDGAVALITAGACLLAMGRSPAWRR